MASCEICGKKTTFGNQKKQIRTGLFSHTKKKIRPNVQKTTLLIDGSEKRITAFTRCIRTNRIRQ